MAKEIICAFGTDIDSVAGWIGSYGGGDSPSDIQRGIFASEVGNIRLLQPVQEIRPQDHASSSPATRSRPSRTRSSMIVEAGHEIGAHGYLHENPIAMTPTQEEAVLVKCIDLIEKLSGKKPRGYVAPWWEMSNSTAALLLKYGFNYDHSQGYRDFQPFYARVGDTLERHRLFQEGRGVDASAQARQGDRPRRDRRQLVCRRPAADDVHEEGAEQPRLRQPARHRGNLARRSSTGSIARWTTRVFAFTIHPDVSGRPQVLLMLERLIEHINGHDGIEVDDLRGDRGGLPQALSRSPAASGRK